MRRSKSLRGDWMKVNNRRKVGAAEEKKTCAGRWQIADHWCSASTKGAMQTSGPGLLREIVSACHNPYKLE